MQTNKMTKDKLITYSISKRNNKNVQKIKSPDDHEILTFMDKVSLIFPTQSPKCNTY